jgi:hypothetical protein
VFQRSALYRSDAMKALADTFELGLELTPTSSPWIRGTEKMETPDGVVAGRRRWGNGRVQVVISDDAFCNRSLGHCMSIPTARQRALYEFLYRVFDYDGPRWDLCRVRK